MNLKKRLNYLEKAFEEMGRCYDHVSARCIDAEESIMWLGKLACLIDKQKIEMWNQLKEAIREMEQDVENKEAMNIIYKYFPELKERDDK